MSVHQTLRLYTTPEKFLVAATSPSGSVEEILVVDRLSREVSLARGSTFQLPLDATSQIIYGIFGIVHLIAGPHLLVITKRSSTGTINGEDIWRVEQTQILPFAKTALHLTEAQKAHNRRYLSMITHALDTPNYYFSYTYDLTHTLQRLFNTSPEFASYHLWERADERFVWNLHLLRPLTSNPELGRFALPILHGFIAIEEAFVKGESFHYVLISRRSILRAGCRYYMRGIDEDGNAANYVETEQIVEFPSGQKNSFVQTRGSMPFFWNQYPNLKYKPRPMIEGGQAAAAAGFHKHFDSQTFLYGRQILLNLVDQKGSEGRLEQTFASHASSLSSSHVRYVAFDFHKECSKMRWHRLSILVDAVAEDQKTMGYFSVTPRQSPLPTQTQEGIFRTNCIDCLDRTNVVQSLLARCSLETQLKDLDWLEPGEKLIDQELFELVFKNAWADNADAMGIQYTGTPALKTDFTRTGARTKWGLLKDGWNSAVRYVKNNFSDGTRQDSIDLILGNYAVESTEGLQKACPLETKEGDRKWRALPLVLLASFALCVFSLYLPAQLDVKVLYFFFFWLVVALLSMALMLQNGRQFVDRPRLVPVKEKRD